MIIMLNTSSRKNGTALSFAQESCEANHRAKRKF